MVNHYKYSRIALILMALAALLVIIPMAGANSYSYICTAITKDSGLNQIDPTTMTITSFVGLGDYCDPYSCVQDHDGTFIYVAEHNHTPSLVKLYLSNFTMAGYYNFTDTGSQPYGTAISRDDSLVYVNDYWLSRVYVMYANNMTLKNTISVNTNPVGIAIHPNDSYLYVACRTGNTIDIISTSSETVVASISTITAAPWDIAVNPNGREVYFDHRSNAVLSYLNTSTLELNNVTIGNSPRTLCVNPNGTKVYVAAGGSSRVYVVDTATHTVIANPWLGSGLQPQVITVSQDGFNVTIGEYSVPKIWFMDGITDTLKATTLNVSSNLIGVGMLSGQYSTLNLNNTSQSVTEGNTLTINYRINCMNPDPKNFTWTITDITTEGDEYTASSGIVSVAANATSGSFTINTVDDENPDTGNEQFRITLSSPTWANVTLGPGITDTITILESGNGPTPTPTPVITIRPYPSGIAYNTSESIPMFNDNSFLSLIDKIFPPASGNGSDDIDLGGAIYQSTKPFYYNGIGTWWIVIVLGCIGGMLILSQQGSPVMITMLLIAGGDALIWTTLPADWRITLGIIIALDVAFIILTAIRGRQTG